MDINSGAHNEIYGIIRIYAIIIIVVNYALFGGGSDSIE
jgi:hypothetical protein